LYFAYAAGGDVNQILDDEQLMRAAEVLKTVSHPARLRIIELLERGERSVTEIQDCLGITQSLTSQHLSNMRVRGVLQSRKNGNMVYYSVKNPDVIKVIRCIRNSKPVEQNV
jgi:ArsR family transcriptional regulator